MANWAWLGGFWDGEGTFGVYTQIVRGNEQFQPYASIVNTDLKIMQYIGSMVDGKVTDSHVSGGNRKAAYRVRLTGRKASAFAKELLPYLIMKKEQAQVVADWEFRSQGGKRGLLYSPDELLFNVQKESYMKAKILNHRGTAPLVGDRS